ncbi:MAG TPA: aldo/keto reductase, partial [Dyella sp.]|uniref:aldo/keto reductase n=1 Tax=Dyella sp. TaxID=1869338 RepID=UPI002F935BF8
GLISGHWSNDRTADKQDFRTHSPRFQGDNLTHNLGLADKLGELANTYGISTAQLVIAWVLTRGEDIVPLVGSRTRARLAEALGALEATLSNDELTVIEQAVPADAAAGDRYNAHGMASLDSER